MLVQENGGAAFIIPFVIMLIVEGKVDQILYTNQSKQVP